MADEPRGCLLFALPARLLGGARPALPAGVALPPLQHGKMHRDDLPHLVKARKAAEGCVSALARGRSHVSDAVVMEVGGRIAALLEHVYIMGERLAEGRRFLEAHAPERLAKERADLELELVGAGAERLIELKRTVASLDRRASHVGRLSAEIDKLAARLAAGTAELQELEARLAGELGSEDLLHELRAHQQAAELAIDAYGETWRELESR